MYLDEPMPLHFETAAEAARDALFAEMNRLGVPVLTLRAELARFERRELFRDAVHPNPVGNRVIASVIARHLSDIASIPAPAGPSAPVPVGR
jgi:lysophospholipase L1-like esterase